jgi:hypothetical protein
LLVAMVMVAVGIYLVNRKTEIRGVRQIQMPD